MQEYIFSQATIEYLENKLIPVLHRAFEETSNYKASEAQFTQQIMDEIAADNADTLPTIKAIVKSVEVKPAEK